MMVICETCKQQIPGFSSKGTTICDNCLDLASVENRDLLSEEGVCSLMFEETWKRVIKKSIKANPATDKDDCMIIYQLGFAAAMAYQKWLDTTTATPDVATAEE